MTNLLVILKSISRYSFQRLQKWVTPLISLQRTGNQLGRFPPYELNVDRGTFNMPFKNGNTYSSCFENDGIGIRQNYPFFDSNKGKVVTLEGAINECRIKNGEKPLSYYKGKELAHVSAYMAYTSRGNKFNVDIPNNNEALNAYENGKRLYLPKGNSTFHALIAMYIRLGPSLGQIYRAQQQVIQHISQFIAQEWEVSHIT